MRKLNFIVFASIVLLMYSNMCISQTIKNFGDTEIHNSAEVGVYSSFINDGMLTGDSGLIGFYGNNSLQLSGTQIPNVFDVEIANENGLFLETSLVISNNLNFIYGNILSSRNDLFSYLELESEAFFQGESNFSKIDGVIQATVNESYLFPTGDAMFLRPMLVSKVLENTVLKCSYSFDDPINKFSNSDSLSLNLTDISRQEFWMLSGVNSLAITISWNDRSSLFKLTSQIQNLTVVGYHKETKKWLDLGSTKTTGTIEEGFITSDELIPDEYEAFTFGSVLENNLPSPNSANYLITPNGDGINDFLFIPDLENYEYNTVQIFNRYGRKVFEAENYTNQFDGAYSLTGPTVGKDSGLPEGVYFYIVNLVDVQLNFQGFLYIDR